MGARVLSKRSFDVLWPFMVVREVLSMLVDTEAAMALKEEGTTQNHDETEAANTFVATASNLQRTPSQ